MTGDATGQHLRSLTSLRFFAALGVVLIHVSQRLPAWSGAETVFVWGQYGVTFFFMLSGFVLTWTYRPGDGARSFYGRRFARVWPLHAATAVFAAVVLLATGKAISLVAIPFVATMTHAFVPSQTFYFALNAPSWSLACEAFFYALFPVLIVWLSRARRPARWALGVYGLVVVATAAVYLLADTLAPYTGQSAQGLIGYTLTYFPPYRLGEFVIGMLIGLAVRGGQRSPLPLSMAAVVTMASLVAVTVVMAAWDYESRFPLASAALIPPFALLILAAATFDLEGRAGWLQGPAWVRLGQGSFALYLVHLSLIWLMVEYGDALPLWLAAAIVIPVAIAVADVAHAGLERPVERVLRRRLGARRELPVTEESRVG